MTEDEARQLDAGDPSLRAEFHVPPAADGSEVAYFAGNSLGLQPRDARRLVDEELEDWARLGVEGHIEGRRPWLRYHEAARDGLGRLVGAAPHEVVAMNTLTVNLHLMLATFYRPAGERFRIVVEDSTFPSDSYAVESQARHHGLDPAAAIVRLTPREGEDTLRTEDVVELLERDGAGIAVVLLGGVNYLTGQWMDMPAITAATHAAGAVAGWDLAHAAGNVPLAMHDWDADFACWCSYKYVNSGPGAVAGCFVHERHARDTTLPRFAGWWGNDPDTRFLMQPGFVPRASADGWQLSNPPIFSLAPLLASLELFDRAGHDALRERSRRLTAALERRLDALCETHRAELITPRDPEARGCQLSLRVDAAGDLSRALSAAGVVADHREPDVIRLAPTPLYGSYRDLWRLEEELRRLVPRR